MVKVGGLLLAVLVAAVGLLGAANASAAELPLYDGAMSFEPITGPESPEEYSWQVWLEPGQELRQIDDEHAAVFYKNGYSAFSVSAAPAADAEGASVPTTLTVTQPNVLTLTVHHREGNPAAGGAPFDYPIDEGPGWSGGFRTFEGTFENGRSPGATPTVEPTKATQRVLVVRALGEDKLYYRPHFFLLSGDGTFGMNKVQWKSYGGATATARARAFVNDCVPYCAAGHIDRLRARLKLSKVVDCGGTLIYARLEYALSGQLPKGFPRRGGYSMRPLGEDGKPEC